MSASATIKNISITGFAAEDFQKGKGTRRRRSGRRTAAAATIETMEPSKITFIPSGKANIIRSGGGEPPAVQEPIIKNNIPPPPPLSTDQQQPQQSGGQTTNLVLKPPKRRETRLLMKAPKGEGIQTSQTNSTRKNLKKITLGLRGLTVKIQRASKLHKKVGDMKKEDVKKVLVEKGILKAGKKDPPESLMRQMYSDYLILTSKGL
jgi:hypothetical protein